MKCIFHYLPFAIIFHLADFLCYHATALRFRSFLDCSTMPSLITWTLLGITLFGIFQTIGISRPHRKTCKHAITYQCLFRITSQLLTFVPRSDSFGPVLIQSGARLNIKTERWHLYIETPPTPLIPTLGHVMACWQGQAITLIKLIEGEWRRQAIIWTNAGILLIGPLETNFREMLIEIQTFVFKKIILKMSSANWRPFVSVSMCYTPQISWINCVTYC